MSEYHERCQALSKKPGRCTCGYELTCVAMVPLTDFTLGLGPRYACHFCDVRIIDQPDEDFCTAVLRHESDEAYDWLPEHMRAACSRGGFGYGISPASVGLDQRFSDFRGEVWAGDMHGIINTRCTLFELAKLRARLPKETNHKVGNKPLATFIDARDYKEHAPVVLDQHFTMIGTAQMDRSYLEMVMALFPGARALSRFDLDPVAFYLDKHAVALFMPCDRRAGLAPK